MYVALAAAFAWPHAASARGRKKVDDPTFTDPRKAPLPGRHRFRLGVEVIYQRLSAGIDPDTGAAQRYHFTPILVDFAYHLQIVKRMMIRPSFALGPNVANSRNAMPFVVHPALYVGYQGRMFGIAAGYGWYQSVILVKDAMNAIRNDVGQPIITNNNHVGGELSLTTRVHGGAISVAARFGMTWSHIQHFSELDKRDWYPALMFYGGWYFGDGNGSLKKAREARRRARAQQTP